MPAVKELKRIDVRQAALAAGEYFKTLYPGVHSYSFEEVELSEDGKYWFITLSFDWTTKSNPLGIFQPPKTKFKVFKVNVKTGEVVSMKIRQLE